MSREELKKTLCRICPNRTHCVNRDKGCAMKDHSCFKESICVKCPGWFYCNNHQKDFIVDASCLEKLDENGIPVCFVTPSCEICPVSYHCKNRGFPDVHFTLKPSVATKPLCFSKYHSEK